MLNDYLQSLIRDQSDGVAREQLELAAARHINVVMPDTANLLRVLVSMTAPRKILEIGTAIGYSGLLMLRSAHPSATLTTLEINEQMLELARGFFDKAGELDRVTMHLGDAKLIVPLLSGSYDFIFMDGAKSGYLDFLPYLYKLLECGGTLVCDNVLYKGWISGDAEPPKRKHDTIIRRMDTFLRELCDHEGLVTSVVGVGDGLSISVRKGL